MPKNIGFVSTRFAGTDGVTLESAKWAEVLWDDRHVSYWYSGLNDRSPDISMVVPEAYFGHSENVWLNEHLWGKTRRRPLVSDRVHALTEYLKFTLYQFVERFDIDVLVLQNCLTIPMHIPLGLAVTEFLSETGMPSIAHHHDFYWERVRFSINAASDYLHTAFPAHCGELRHVVINRQAEQQLSLRRGVSSMLIPNVFDFEQSPPQLDEYTKDIRKDLGLAEDDILILQPTRIVPRKGIEHSIKLVGRLANPRYKLVISHDAGDEGMEYKQMLQEMATEENVDIRFVSTKIGEVRQFDAEGNKVYTLWDLYPHADLVTYPSTYEGFGNALLEAIYFRIPILVNRYSIYVQDIEPKGFRIPSMDGIVTNRVVDEVRRILEDEAYRENMVDHNYRIARKYYSYSVLRRSLRALLTSLTGLQN